MDLHAADRLLRHTRVNFQDFYGIKEMVFLATPITVNRLGVKGWYTINLDDDEMKRLQETAKKINAYQKTLLIY